MVIHTNTNVHLAVNAEICESRAMEKNTLYLVLWGLVAVAAGALVGWMLDNQGTSLPAL